MTAPNWRIAGNERAVRALQSGVAGGSPAHAYLFLGPEHTGRATAAIHLAQALNCTDSSPPCGECNQCRRIEAGIHSDVVTLTLESDDNVIRKNISESQIDELRGTLTLKAYEGRTRVAIINPADAMSESAQNKLLLTLEEPAPSVAIILVATDDDMLLETIRSRCARIDFGLVAAADIETALIERGATPNDARLLARLSGGRPGWAIDALADPKVLEHRRDVLDAARSLARLPLADRMDLAEKLSDAFKRDRDAVLSQLDEWAAWWRDVLLVQSWAADRIANLDRNRELEEDAVGHSRAEIAAFLQAIIETRTYLVENVQSRIALDALMLAAP